MKGITYTQVAQYCVLIFAFMALAASLVTASPLSLVAQAEEDRPPVPPGARVRVTTSIDDVDAVGRVIDTAISALSGGTSHPPRNKRVVERLFVNQPAPGAVNDADPGLRLLKGIFIDYG